MLGSYAVYPLTADVLHVSHEIGLACDGCSTGKIIKNHLNLFEKEKICC